ncbi:albusnodin family lasso peptide [Streptomyces sp. NPDC056149]
MPDQLNTTPVEENNDLVAVELGDAVELTEGQGSGHSEDKRRAYN